MTKLQTSLCALLGTALTLSFASGAAANDISVPMNRSTIQEVRSSWAPGFTRDAGQYVRTIPAPAPTGMATRLVGESRQTWKAGFQNDGGRYVRYTLTQTSAPDANVAHFENHYSSGASREGDGSWIHFN